MQRLQLLNSTVAQLAKATNAVLSATYNALYGDDDNEGEEDPAQLKLVTSPLAAADEVEKLFTAQLIDIDTALPAALHALGATAEEIEKALERGKAKEQKQCQCEDEERAFQKKDRDVAFKEREVNLRKTEADIKKTEHDAKAPLNTGPSPGAGAGGSK